MQIGRFERFATPAALARAAGGLAVFTILALCFAPEPASAAPIRAPKPAPTPPFANGDTFQYTITDTSVINFPSQPPKTTTTIKSANETVVYPVTYGSKKNVYRLATVVQDASDPYGYVEQDFVGFDRVGSIYALEYFAQGETYYDASNPYGSQQVTNSKPFDITAEYPESVGLQWDDNFAVAYTFSESFGSVTQSITERQQADGAYDEVQTTTSPSGQATTQYDLKSNGTGTLIEQNPSQPTLKYLFGLPFEQGGAEVIPVKLGRNTTYVPDWFPGGGQPLSPLESLSVVIASFANTPAACGSQAGQAAYDIHQTGYGLDPVGGLYVTTQTDEYDSPTQGMICSVVNNQFAFYDNLVSGAIEFTETITDVEVLTGTQISPLHGSARAPVHPLRRRPPARTFVMPAFGGIRPGI